MKLSDVMSGAGLSAYAEVALVLFVVVFCAVAVRLFVRGRADDWTDAARLPFDEEAAGTPRRPH